MVSSRSSANRIVVLGAGFGGLTIATELDSLAAQGKVEVTLVDRKPNFSVGFSMQWAMVGRRQPEDGQRPYTSRTARHVNFVQDEVTSIDTGGKSVQTISRRLEYDYLVIALGAEMAPERIPGLSEAAFDLHDTDSVMRMKTALENINSGTVLIMVSALPFKCPPAPYEYSMLIDDMLRTRGVREQVSVLLSTPEPQPMPLAGKVVGDLITGLLTERGIEHLFQHTPVSISASDRKVRYENGADLSYDVLGAVYPHQAPKILRDAGLTNDMGFVPADISTFETKVPDVFAIGDVAALRLPTGQPHPKAGAFAEAQATALTKSLAAKITGGESVKYSGLGGCFVDSGGEMATVAEAQLLAEGGPRFSMRPPSREGLERKVEFERERLVRWFGR